MLGVALTVGVTPIEVKEIVYQAVPYVGMAKVFDFIHATNDVLADRGIQLPLEGQSMTTLETREEKWLAVEKEIVGADVVDHLYASESVTRCTSSTFSLPTASATTTRAPAST